MANERIARMERLAAKAGVTLSQPTKSSREFALSAVRTIRFQPQGKGTMRIEARINGVIEASSIMRDGRVEELIIKAANGGVEES